MKVKKYCCGNCTHLEEINNNYYCHANKTSCLKSRTDLNISIYCKNYAEKPLGILRIWERVFKLNNYD